MRRLPVTTVCREEGVGDCGEAAREAEGEARGLPRAGRCDPRHRGPSLSAHGQKVSRPRILVVDDDERYRSILARLLESVADVDTAADGVTALDRLRARAFDWVLLDVAMRGLDGFEILRRIRELEAPPRVIVHSALEGIAERAWANGARAVLPKPLDLVSFRKIILENG